MLDLDITEQIFNFNDCLLSTELDKSGFEDHSVFGLNFTSISIH